MLDVFMLRALLNSRVLRCGLVPFHSGDESDDEARRESPGSRASAARDERDDGPRRAAAPGRRASAARDESDDEARRVSPSRRDSATRDERGNGPRRAGSGGARTSPKRMRRLFACSMSLTLMVRLVYE